MDFKDLLIKQGFDLDTVMVLRPEKAPMKAEIAASFIREPLSLGSSSSLETERRSSRFR
jgi:hypothetical protein